jgi:hypothetical protein
MPSPLSSVTGTLWVIIMLDLNPPLMAGITVILAWNEFSQAYELLDSFGNEIGIYGTWN